MCRDAIKEGLHVTHASDDPAEVRRFSAAASDVFWSSVGTLVDAEVSLVAEPHCAHVRNTCRHSLGPDGPDPEVTAHPTRRWSAERRQAQSARSVDQNSSRRTRFRSLPASVRGSSSRTSQPRGTLYFAMFASA